MLYFEDFPVGAVYELGSRSLSQDQIVAFARDYDPQPFHIDPVAAKSSAFGTLIASGWQTVGVFMSLLVRSMLGDSASMGSPGVEGIQWLKPVKPGDRLDRPFARARSDAVEKRGPTAASSRPKAG